MGSAFRCKGWVAALLAVGAMPWAAACDRNASPPGPPPLDVVAVLADADTLVVRDLVPGIRHVYAWDGSGPWAIHILEIDREPCRPGLEVRKAGPPLADRARTSTLAGDALAAVNGDFFGIPAGTPVGAHVRDGEILMGPGARPVFALAEDRFWIGAARVRGRVIAAGDTLPLVQVNRSSPAGDAGAVLYTLWIGDAAPAADRAGTTWVRRTGGGLTAGQGVVRARGDAGARPDSGTVILAGTSTAADWLARLQPGDTVRWEAALVPADADAPAAVDAVGGFPVLLRGGRVPLDLEAGVRPAFGQARHPRTAVAVGAGGRSVLLVAVDGRQEPYSAGMSLRELAELLRRMGADEALNLDGGGSTAMVVSGEVVNRPADPVGERPVGNAVAVTAGDCQG